MQFHCKAYVSPKHNICFFYLPWLHIAQKCVLFRKAEVQGREKWILMIFQPIGHPHLLIIQRQLSIQACNVEVRYDRSRFPCSHPDKYEALPKPL